MRTFAGESTIDAIKMIYLNDHIYDFDLETALGELSEQRRQQALRYRHELGQRTCVAAYLLLRQGLREEYDIDQLNPRKNPYAKELKKQVTIKLSPNVIEYFKAESTETGIPYQTLINLYLQDCVKNKKKIDLSWKMVES